MLALPLSPPATCTLTAQVGKYTNGTARIGKASHATCTRLGVAKGGGRAGVRCEEKKEDTSGSTSVHSPLWYPTPSAPCLKYAVMERAHGNLMHYAIPQYTPTNLPEQQCVRRCQHYVLWPMCDDCECAWVR